MIKQLFFLGMLLGPQLLAQDQLPKIKWTAIPEAKSYVFQLAEDDAFQKIIKEGALDSPELMIGEDIPAGQYYLRVASVDDDKRRGPFSKGVSVNIEAIRIKQMELYKPKLLKKELPQKVPAPQKQSPPFEAQFPTLYGLVSVDASHIKNFQRRYDFELGVSVIDWVSLSYINQRSDFSDSTEAGKEIKFHVSRTGVGMQLIPPYPLFHGYLRFLLSFKFIRKNIAFEINHFSSNPEQVWEMRPGGGFYLFLNKHQSFRFITEIEQPLKTDILNPIKPRYVYFEGSYRHQIFSAFALEPYLRMEIEKFAINGTIPIEKEAAPALGLRFILSL